MDDTKEVELRAEKQLTRRYWRLLGGISDALSRVVAAKVEAATLAVRLSGVVEYYVGRLWPDNAVLPTRETDELYRLKSVINGLLHGKELLDSRLKPPTID